MSKPPENLIMDFIEDMIYFQKHKDEHGMAVLMEEGKAKHVTLDVVGEALLDIVNDVTTFVDTSQALQEVRLRAIIEALDPETQEKIKQTFIGADDDLFAAEGE